MAPGMIPSSNENELENESELETPEEPLMDVRMPGFKEAGENCGNCRHLQMGAEPTCAKFPALGPIEDTERNWCCGYEG